MKEIVATIDKQTNTEAEEDTPLLAKICPFLQEESAKSTESQLHCRGNPKKQKPKAFSQLCKKTGL